MTLYSNNRQLVNTSHRRYFLSVFIQHRKLLNVIKSRNKATWLMWYIFRDYFHTPRKANSNIVSREMNDVMGKSIKTMYFSKGIRKAKWHRCDRGWETPILYNESQSSQGKYIFQRKWCSMTSLINVNSNIHCQLNRVITTQRTKLCACLWGNFLICIVMEKAFPLGQYLPNDWGPGPNKRLIGWELLPLLYLCFLNVGVTWEASSNFCHCDFPARTVWVPEDWTLNICLRD